MQHTVQIDDGIIPPCLVPVRFGIPKSGEAVLNYDGSVSIAMGLNQPRLIVEAIWTAPNWLRPGWLFSNNCRTWMWSSRKPRFVDGTWSEFDACVHINSEAVRFNPPLCSDPAFALFEVRNYDIATIDRRV